MHKRFWKVLRRIVLAAVVLTAAALLGGGWYYADQLKDGALVVKHSPTQYDMEVVALEGGRITLKTTTEGKKDGDWTKAGLWGLEWGEEYGQVGAILSINEQQVVRGFFPLEGLPKVGERVHLGSFGFPVDVTRVASLHSEEVAYESPLGQFPAWLIQAPGTTWVIFVHGKGTLKLNDLRLLPLLMELGLSSLRMSYRNDEGVPTNPDGFYRYGQAEWEDLEGAVRYALDHGAQDVVLVGHSMGGSIVMSFLYRSSLAPRVRGVILDSPMLDFNAVVDLAASQRHIPGPFALPLPPPLTAIAKALSGPRFGVDWKELNYLRRSSELKMPILLFHGGVDATVPLATSDALARARPDLVTYVRVPGATHVRSWNVGPEAYEKAVRDFLQGVTK
ncbi:MAG: alpha/beta fold hydrolase [Dehalococcoidia bacterium]|nr:alpha/beta fold hydrolase [Dehalococcoidia bacterium]